MSTKRESRRSFLLASVTGVNAAWVAANYPGILAAQEHVRLAAKAGALPPLTFFNDAQAAEIEAMAAQIIPTDESPGAREAHCLYFIDRALSGFAKSSQPVYTQGLQDLQSKTKELYPDAGKFSALTSEQQIKVLTAIEKTPFFRTVRTHTVIGFFSRPVHGGNYDKIGFKLIGYDDSLNHKPPFGYYDALPQPPRRS
ncbi:MAG TPA: gluconate 2-dehydrogenase subunit 3 family protein [Bryobacteraceae bacterium]|nr:gluconate 2-dehydrogenase subunit 3 family protein [Bryobacteraceae bacterium]